MQQQPAIKKSKPMKVHTTNYQNTFIEVAEDSPVTSAEIPPVKGADKTIANLQFEMIIDNPYQFSSDDVLFHCFATRNKIPTAERKLTREQFFSKGQPCFRASPLTKRYGWGLHCNKDGKIALYGCETKEYKKFSTDKNLKVIKAMKSGR
jgi:hypothetical protein